MVYSKRNAVGNNKFAFTSHYFSDYSFCFSNVLDSGISSGQQYFRSISFDVKMGAETADEADLAKREKLKPIEAELQILERTLAEIVENMDYLKNREINMRNTNESTNSRVKWFSLLSILTLVSSGLWQIFYLRQFFKSKKLM